MNPNRKIFLAFCSEITGYPAIALEGTGLVDAYQELLEQVLGQSLAIELYAAAESVLSVPEAAQRESQMRALVLTSQVLWPIVANLISLWYLGSWSQLPAGWYSTTGLTLPGPTDPGRSHVPSAQSYVEQLSYRTAGAHPPGAKPTGFGSWSLPPVFETEGRAAR
jgi:hypothetical protein